MTDQERFGAQLRKAREARGLGLSDVAARTAVPAWSLGFLEEGRFAELPADVFVRGFVRAYARAVGLDQVQALAEYDNAIRGGAWMQATAAAAPDDTARRGVGMALFVIILLLIAALTLSLLLRRPPDVGEGLSLRAPASLKALGAGVRRA